MVGTDYSCGLLTVWAVIYLASGADIDELCTELFPPISVTSTTGYAFSIFRFMPVLEMGLIYVKDMEVAKNYPKAVFIGAAITVIIFVLGTFALGIIIAKRTST